MIVEYLVNLLNEFEKLKERGLFSFLVNYPQTLIQATSVAFVANVLHKTSKGMRDWIIHKVPFF
jgi:hypothetical protein